MQQFILEVRDLRVSYHTPRGPIKAVDGVSFNVGAGERFGLVGESGCGKSTTAMALLQLIQPRAYRER
jgi:ABC-type dipeptide/oligopeptide/nickel transport system ATPase component